MRVLAALVLAVFFLLVATRLVLGTDRTGLASHYGPGHGVAMNYCTWKLRHGSGCGSVTITSHDTGRTVTVPVIDYCDCYTGTPDERLVDLQYGVMKALGLPEPYSAKDKGLYPVSVHGAGAGSTLAVPDTAMGTGRARR